MKRLFGAILLFAMAAANAQASEKALYAVSSLYSYLTELNDTCHEDTIAYQDAEIAALWEATYDAPCFTQVDQARQLYDLSVSADSLEKSSLYLSQSRTLLAKAWEELKGDTRMSQAKEASVKARMNPFVLPQDNPLYGPLNGIFSSPIVLTNTTTFSSAGFKTLYYQPVSHIVVARHSALPGHLIKCYLHSEKRRRAGTPGWKWLIQRCEGAQDVRDLIREKHLKHFSVPDKWLFIPPADTNPFDFDRVILLVTDMKLVSKTETQKAWRKATKEQLDELYCILSHGLSSCYLTHNIPMTKSGKFTCIDTEVPRRKHRLSHVKRYLSDEMKTYWDLLVKTGGNPQ